MFLIYAKGDAIYSAKGSIKDIVWMVTNPVEQSLQVFFVTFSTPPVVFVLA